MAGCRPVLRGETMDHRQYIEEYLSADVDQALSAAERQVVSAHLVGCAECRQRREDERALKALLRRDIPILSAPQELRQQIIAALDREPAPSVAAPSEQARSKVRYLRFSRRPLWLGSLGAAAAAAVVLVLVLVKGLGRPPAHTPFDAAINDYFRSEQSFAASAALNSPTDLALALSMEFGYPIVWDFSSVGLTLTGARVEHRPDGRSLIYSLYKGKAGSILCINFRQADLVIPPGGQEVHGVHFYKYRDVWIGVVNYGQVFCYFVTRLTPTQLLPALIHNGPKLGRS